VSETAVITGANRGIGLALTRRFLDAGWRVIAACRQPDRATELNRLAGGALDIRQVELTDGGSVTSLCDGLAHETVDLLVNNAGVMARRQGRSDMDYDEWLTSFAVNTLAPFRLATGLLPALRRSPRPRVMTLSSQMGALDLPGGGYYAYRSSKAAVNKTMQTLAGELEGEGVVVCVVHPGWVRTDMGGPGASISPHESAAGLFDLATSLTLEHTGRFFNWDGREHAW